MDFSKYRDMYLSEAAEHLQKMSKLLVEIEADPHDRGGIDALFREAHSIKGMAATMSYEATAQLAHHLEDSLSLWRDRGGVDSDQIDRLLEGVDLLEGLLEDVRNEQPERDVTGFIQAAAEEPSVEVLPPEELELIPNEEDTADQGTQETEEPPSLQIRLRLGETVSAPGPRWLVLLQRLSVLGKVAESTPSEAEILQGAVTRQLLVSLRTDLSRDEIRERLKSYRELESIDFPVTKLPDKTLSTRKTATAPTVRVGTDLLDHFINLTGELITNRYMLQSAASARNWRDVNEGLSQLARLVRNLHHQVLQVRMMPLDSITGRLHRTVRDLSRNLGKEVRLELEGNEIELDRAILEELADPLLHMVRNAIDHGIERSGTVRLKAWRERDQVLVQVADNGRGIDPETIRQRAIDRDLISPAQGQSMRDYDLLQLICSPGFSTTNEVNEASGRGVGMDVVKTSVERLGGVLLIDSAVGEGTRITMKLPLSVAIIRVLEIECATMVMALPITRVLQTLEISPADVQTSGKQLVISLHGELLPLLSLRKILGKEKGPTHSSLSLVITEVLGRKVGLVVDRLVGQREVFVQNLPVPFDNLRGCSSGSILGDGRIVFVLDLQSLLEKRRK